MDPIEIHSDSLSLRILPRGAALVGVRLRPFKHNLVLGFQDPEDHLRQPGYLGALVGPIANRISDGRVPLGDETFQMQRNENGVTALHSGQDGIHAHLWQVTDRTEDSVTLETQLTDGASGLPGNRTIRATYQLTGATFELRIEAETDRATPMNIAAHPYWCLDDTGDIGQHRLTVFADRYTPVNDLHLPTGEVAETADTPFDFASHKAVPRDPALDVNFCLAKAAQSVPASAAMLTGASGISLNLATTAPGLQVYNGAHLPNMPGMLDGGKDLRPYGGIALEPQFWPDAPNQPAFPQITLHPGSVWQQVTTYRFSYAD